MIVLMRATCTLFVLSVSCGLTACAQERVAPFALDAPQKTAGSGSAQPSEHRPHAGMLRYPDVSATSIVFVYANDLWVVPREGGVATPLASPAGMERFPRFSPDGRTIGFMGNYDGNPDLYTMSVAGSVPTRVTHHPATETLCDWTPDGKLLFFSNALAGLRRQTQLFTTSPTGGMPEKLPIPYGANGSISSDGQWLAYTPHSRDHRTWKRYRGGMATDIWLFNLRSKTARKVTEWEGTDTQPMWHGPKLYYLSDGGSEHRLNIWVYDPSANRRKQLTHQIDFDVKWPSIGPGADGQGEIVFQNGSALQLLSLSTGAIRTVDVVIPGDRPKIRPYEYDADKFITSWDISSTGKRAVFGSRGDLWTVPAKNGSPRNLTRSSGVAERDPSWSPDGQWLAYFCDETGEYELYIKQSDGRGETRKLTSDATTFRFAPTWSPDSKMIVFSDKSGAMFLHTIESGETRGIDKDLWGRQARMNWAHDSRWITYTKTTDKGNIANIWLYDVAAGEKHQVTSGMFNDSWPTFDRRGEYLFFASNRDFSSPAYEDIGTSFIYADTDVLLAVPLRGDVGSPWAPKSDEEKWGEDKDEDDDENGEESASGDDNKDDEAKKDGDGASSDDDADNDKDEDDGDEEDADKKDGDKKKDEIKPVEIDLEGFERRAIPLPVDRGSFFALAVNHKGHLLYVRGAKRGSGGKPSIKIFDLSDEKKEEKTVVEETGSFVISADGKKILVRKDKTAAIVDAKAEQKLDKPMKLAAMKGTVNPHEEWAQMFHEAWRIQRDYFYDPNMHGVDWQAVHDRYEVMLRDCASREDLDFVIGEMISELNVGHAYVRGGGDREEQPRVNVGMTGADFELHEGAYRISKIYEGAAWDYDARGPLSQPGVDVKVGDYLLAVNDIPLDTGKDPWAAFLGLGGKVVSLTVSDKPTMDDEARRVLVELKDSEANLRYRAWIERNRAYVDEKTAGRVGYIYVPDTGRNGQNNLIRQFYGQRDKAALIIDERWNGGGQIPTRFIELLNRPITNYWATRSERDWSWPPDAHAAPKCMLINGLAGSGGDCFPYYFRQAGLGKLIGMRTWGGLVGISGNPSLVDGGRTSSPTFAFYETDGTWGVEGHGVDPDIEVIDDPSKMTDGGDPQLDAAIEHMLAEIKRNPYTPPKRPAYPDRSGMGVREEDK